jgi:hypothetical protein
MIETAVTDVIGPAIAADDPDILAHQRTRHGKQILHLAGGAHGAQASFKFRHACALLVDALFIGLVRLQ